MIRVFLLLEKKGTKAKGISPINRAGQGRPILEPRNTPATQAQLTYRSHIYELYQSKHDQPVSVVKWSHAEDAASVIVVTAWGRAPLPGIEWGDDKF